MGSINGLEMAMRLSDLHHKLTLEESNPSGPSIEELRRAREVTGTTIDRLVERGLNRAAIQISSLTTQLEGETQKIIELRNRLDSIAQVIGATTALLNSITSVRPFL